MSKQFVETMKKAAEMVGVKTTFIAPPTKDLGFMVYVESEAQCSIFALALTRSGIDCRPVSRNGRHYIFGA